VPKSSSATLLHLSEREVQDHLPPPREAIALVRDANQLIVSIADNGQGFDVAKAMQASQATTFGLCSMRERALLLNGSLVVHSRPGLGTTVTLHLPLRS